MFDREILLFFLSLHGPVLDGFMIFITHLGDAGLVWIAFTLLMAADRESRKESVQIALALILEPVICNLILKPLVARPRPFSVMDLPELMIPAPDDFSFPSGHTGAAFAATFAQKQHRPSFLILSVLIGISRTYLLVHWPSDVLAGAIIGMFCGLLATKVAAFTCGWLRKTHIAA